MDKKGNDINLLFYYDNDSHRFEIGNYEDITSTLQSGITNITNNSFNNDYIFYNENILKLISRPTLLSNQNLGYINNIEDFNKSKHNINFNYLCINYLIKYKIIKQQIIIIMATYFLLIT